VRRPVVRKTVFSGDYMSHLTEQFFAETGDKAMYRMKSSDYYTLRYVKWLEAKVENGSSHNKQSIKLPKKAVENIVECISIQQDIPIDFKAVLVNNFWDLL